MIVTRGSRVLAIAFVLAQPLAAQVAGTPRFKDLLEPGPYAVGFRVIDQFDASRSPASEAVRAHPRHLHGRPIETLIWYPAQATASASRMHFRDYAETYAPPGSFPNGDVGGRRRAVAGLLAYLGQTDSASDLVRVELASSVHAVAHAAPLHGRFPVVIYAPGSGGPAIENALLGEFLASHGYVFVPSPSYGGEFSDGFRSTLEPTARDMEFLIGFVRGLPDVDATRVGLIGHSWGGIANVLVASRNVSIAALVSIDGTVSYAYDLLRSAASIPALREYSVPSLFIRADWPESARRRLQMDSTFVFFDSLRYADAYDVTVAGMRHRNCCSLENRLLAPGNTLGIDDPTEFNPDRTYASALWAVIAQTTLNFLDARLKAGASGGTLPDGRSRGRGVDLTVRYKRAWPALTDVLAGFTTLDPEHIRAQSQRLRDSLPGYDDLDQPRLDDWTLVRIRQRDSTNAIAGARVLVTLYPGSAEAQQVAGVAARNLQNDTVRAIAHFREALRIDPSRGFLSEWIAQLTPHS